MNEIPSSERISILSGALPHIRKYHGKTVVVKAGGRMLVDKKLREIFATDISLVAALGIQVIVVHGGGPQIDLKLKEAGIQEKRIDGLRVTDEKTLKIVDQILYRDVNVKLANAIHATGVASKRIHGANDQILKAYFHKDRKYGFVGEVAKVDKVALANLIKKKFVPVIAPIGISKDGQHLNINADVAATAVAIQTKASVLLLMTDTDGILDGENEFIDSINAFQAKKLIKQGIINKGMKPKVECAIQAVDEGVESCWIINGVSRHALIVNLLTNNNTGTKIERTTRKKNGK